MSPCGAGGAAFGKERGEQARASFGGIGQDERIILSLREQVTVKEKVCEGWPSQVTVI